MLTTPGVSWFQLFRLWKKKTSNLGKRVKFLCELPFCVSSPRFSLVCWAILYSHARVVLELTMSLSCDSHQSSSPFLCPVIALCMSLWSALNSHLLSVVRLREYGISAAPSDLVGLLTAFSLCLGLPYLRAHGTERAAVRMSWVEGKSALRRQDSQHFGESASFKLTSVSHLFLWKVMICPTQLTTLEDANPGVWMPLPLVFRRITLAC